MQHSKVKRLAGPIGVFVSGCTKFTRFTRISLQSRSATASLLIKGNQFMKEIRKMYRVQEECQVS
eukprot:1150737-Pelagomonas_calceolata.AAC.1